jgi:hypothetical protein
MRIFTMSLLAGLFIATVPNCQATAAGLYGLLLVPIEGRPPSLFIGMSERDLVMGGHAARVICAGDGAGQVVVELGGVFYAANGMARSWAKKRGLFVVFDDGTRKEVIVPGQTDPVQASDWHEPITVGNEMCPSPDTLAGIVERITIGQRTYELEAPRLGLKPAR